VVPTIATFAPPALLLKSIESSLNADLRAFVIPLELYLLSVANDNNSSTGRRRRVSDAQGRLSKPLF